MTDRQQPKRCRTAWALAAGLIALVPPGSARADAPASARPIDFARDVLPVFQKHCVSCHGPKRQKGGLRLDLKTSALKGGDTHAPAIIPGNGEKSPLIQFVSGLDEDFLMPPDPEGRRKLTDAEIGVLRSWIDQGAVWPSDAGAKTDDPLSHWAYLPLNQPPVPSALGSSRNPIDAFLDTRLRAAKVEPSPEADRRTLIRRLTFDLHGLPPAPEAIEAFVNDRSPLAYENLVDRLLAAPQFGERFARLWLDVAHFGESHGFGMDRPRRNAWPYRDYLIDAFNTDAPYARFVQEQVAADALFPDESDKTPALGLAAAGPFNQSALAEQVDDTDCKRSALNLDRDDMVSSVAATFLSMTVHCARCHDHKFDPISQADYYRLQAVFAGVGRADREYDSDPKVAARRKALLAEKAALVKNPDAPTTPDETRRLQALRARWEAVLSASLRGWTVLNPSIVTTRGALLARQADGSLLAGGPSAANETYTLTLADVPPGTTALMLELLPNPTLPHHGPGRAENGNFHLTEWKAFRLSADGEPKPVALKNPSADFEQAGWEIAKALDGNPATGWGIHPEEGKPHSAIVELVEDWDPESGSALRLVLEQDQGRQHTIGRFRLSAYTRPRPAKTTTAPPDVVAALTVPKAARTPGQEANLARRHRRADLDGRLAALPEPRRVFAIAGEFPAFRNYKPTMGPLPIRVLRRGDLKQPLDLVKPGALSCVRALPFEFRLANPSDEKERRAAFARWLTDPANPLTWRSIANRVWQWHFGVGLVETPNDFGKNGGRPSHPELLDWLAVSVRDGGGSLKALHRLMVTSAAYRRSSAFAPSADDSDNRRLAHRSRLRLDAEQVRDALLVISGRLDPTMRGPSVMQFVFHDPNKEVAPRIEYAGFDPDSPASLRRGVYRFLFRNVNDPLLEAFDAADPSLSTPRRNVTITPQQALSLWNSRFVLRQCEHLASRLEREAPDLPTRLDRACRLAWGRSPEHDELALLRRHADRHGLASACRVVLNANDFLFVH